jgi:cell division protein FtsB
MKIRIFALFAVLLVVGCGEEVQDIQEEPNGSSHLNAEANAVAIDSSGDFNSSTLISCEACGKKISVLSGTCIGCGHPIVTLRKTFGEYSKWKAREAFIEKELKELRLEVKEHEAFLERLRKDPAFKDAIAREELGNGKPAERLYRLPADLDP